MQHPWSGLSGLPRASWTLAGASLVNRAGTMVLPFLAIYLTRELGFATELAGALFAVYGAGALAAGLLLGRLADRFGPVRVIVGCLVSSGLVLLAFPLAHSAASVAAFVLVFALTAEGVRPTTMTLAGAIASPERRKDAFVLNRLATNLGMSVGPAVGGLLASVDFRLLFLIDGATSILAALVLGLSFRKELVRSEPPKAKAAGHRLGAFGDVRFVRFLLGVLFVAAVFFQLDAAMPLYFMGEMRMPSRVYGVLFTINTGLILLLEVRVNVATRAWSHAKTLTTGALLCGFGFGGFVLVHGVAGAAACILLLTFGEMVLFPGMSAFVADAAPEGRTGQYMGAFSTAFALAYSVSPALGTLVLTRFGATVLWPGVFLVSLASAALLASATRRSAAA